MMVSYIYISPIYTGGWQGGMGSGGFQFFLFQKFKIFKCLPFDLGCLDYKLVNFLR